MLYSEIIKGDPEKFKPQVLNFIGSYQNSVMLDSNRELSGPIPYTGTRYNFIAAAGKVDEVRTSTHSLEQLDAFIKKHKNSGNWIFGCLGYDLKNEIESLVSENPDASGFPVIHFFIPEIVIIGHSDRIELVSVHSLENTWKEIKKFPERFPDFSLPAPVRFTHIPGRDSYREATEKLLWHIRYGNIYEVNYCHQLVAETQNMNAPALFARLNNISPNPFSCYYRTASNHLICASPERFLARRNGTIISQPIKGTAPRGADQSTDQLNLQRLQSSEKERAENIMIADLVRNDLSKIAQKGTVKAEELCRAYTYSRVHQLVSTITCEAKEDVSFIEMLKALFPMGSMTGAPKISAMKLIEQYENFRRSAYSGAVGYIDPQGDFDFNVVIRSILFRDDTGVLSVAAGSALTAASDPSTEFDETIIKMSPQLEALGISREMLLKEIPDARLV